MWYCLTKEHREIVRASRTFDRYSSLGKWREFSRARAVILIVRRLISSFHFCRKRSRSRRAHLASTISCNLEGHIDTWLEGCWIPGKSEGASRGYIILRFRSKKLGEDEIFYYFYQKGDQKEENKSEIYVAEKGENRRRKEEWSASSNRKQSCLGMYDFTWNR